MVKCFYDLHIHSCLSSCADELMTLHNIVNMSKLKGLNIIAITDHNSAKNYKAFMEITKDCELLVIPGIEVETYEGIHMLCYFQTLKDLLIFDKIVYKNLPRMKNNEKIFGQQTLLDVNDDEIGKVAKMLNNTTNIKLNELINIIQLFKGIVIPAHIDRKSNSLLSILGLIPKEILVHGLEISNKGNLKDYQTNNALNKYRIIQNSDAHYIEDICERMNYLNLEECSIEAFFAYFEQCV